MRLWDRLCVLLLIFLRVELNFNFKWSINRIVDNFEFSLSSRTKFPFWISLLDFSANSDLNFVIFDSVDLSWILLS